MKYLSSLYCNIDSPGKPVFLLIALFTLLATGGWSQINDVGIIDVESPTNQCTLSEQEMVKVTLFNFGDIPQSLIPFRFSVNGQDVGVMQPTDGFFTGVLGPDSMVTVEFETTYDFSSEGIYSVAAWTELATDADLSNDTFFYEVEHIATIAEIPYFSNYIANEEGWFPFNETGFNNSWAFGTPAGQVITDAATGNFAYVTNPDGDYQNNEHSYLLSPCMDFSGFSQDPILGFSIYYNTELSYDGAWLESSTDGGASWSKLGQMGSGTNWYNFNNTFTGLGDVWAGDSNGWLNAQLLLSGFAGEPAVRFRFAFDSDGSITFEGIGIDDVHILVPVANDLAALDLSTNSTQLCGDEMDHLTITIRNYGNDPQTGFDVSYQIDGGPVVTENVGALVVNPGESVGYTFDALFNSAIFNASFNITAWTSLPSEMSTVNDTVDMVLNTFAPDVLPLLTDFEEMVTPPGWFNSDLVGNGHNNVSYVAYDNLWSGDQEYELRSPVFGPINPGDSLTFDYRYSDYFPGTTATILGDGDVLEIAVSTDCGQTFTTIHTIDQNNHIPIVEMTNVLLDLDDYAGEYIQVRFLGFWGTGDYWLDLDNINVLGCPPSLGLNASITPVSSAGGTDGAVSVQPSQGLAPYSYEWSNGNTSNSITGLAEGNYTLTVTDALGCVSVLVAMVGLPTNTKEIDLVNHFRLMPNPTSGHTMLDVGFLSEVDFSVRVLSPVGQTLYRFEEQYTLGGTYPLDLSQVGAGVYFVQVMVDGTVSRVERVAKF